MTIFCLRTAALNRAIRSWADENELDAAASSCWGAMRQNRRNCILFYLGELTDEKLRVAARWISMALSLPSWLGYDW